MGYRWLIATLLVAASTPLSAQVAADETLRLIRTLPSPWGEPLTKPFASGTTLKFTPLRFEGPAPLKCAQAKYVFVRSPAEGLFEGNLPAPAAKSAQALGMPASVVTQRVLCDNGGFDIHRSADGRAWVGLDNAVLQWERTAISPTPEAVVQTLLIQHFATDMALTSASIAAQSARLSTKLRSGLLAWLQQSERSDEVPELNGDPFTDTQEAPETFELSAARVTGDQADIAVTYRDEGQRSHVVHFELLRERGSWRVHDILLRDRERLSELLTR